MPLGGIERMLSQNLKRVGECGIGSDQPAPAGLGEGRQTIPLLREGGHATPVKTLKQVLPALEACDLVRDLVDLVYGEKT